MTIPSLDLALGAVDPQAVAFIPADGTAVPQAVPQPMPQAVPQPMPQFVSQTVPQSAEQTDFKSAPALDPEAVARFREVLDAPLADNARLQDQLARAVAYVATASTAIESAGALPVAEVSVGRQPAMSQTELGLAPAPANVTPGNRPAVGPVAREDAPVTAELPVAEKLVPPSAPKKVVRGDAPEVAHADVETLDASRMPAVDVPSKRQDAVQARSVTGSVATEAAPVTAAGPAVVRDDDSEDVVLQALPQGTVVQAEGSAPVRETAPVAAPVAAEHVARAEAAEMQMLVAAANEVADAILVSPGLLRGQGEILVRLKPDVLSGTEIRIETTGRTLSVEFQPTVPDVAVLIERNLPGLQERLAMNVAAFDVAVSVRANAMAGRERVRKTGEDA